MKKSEIIEMLQKQLAKHGEYSLAESNRVFDDVVDTIAKAVVKSGKVSILGFGTFSVKQRAARTGIKPLTKEKIKIKAKKVVSFKPSKSIKVK